MKSRVIILLFFALLIESIAFSQTPPYYHYTDKDGLSNSNIIKIYQDKKGYIWLSTFNGLNKFDGTEFKIYSRADGLTSSVINNIMEDPDSTFWAGSNDKGFFNFKNEKFILSDIKDTKTYRFAYFIKYYDTIVTFNHASINIITKNEEKVFNVNDFGYNFEINGIYRISGSHTILTTSQGLFIFNEEGKIFTQLSGYYDTKKNVSTLYQDDKGKIYFSANNQIYESLFENGNLQIHNIISIENKDAVINCITKDKNGNIWFSAISSGIYIYSKGSVIKIGENVGLSKTNITALLTDRDDNIWVGTMGKGLYCIYAPYLTIFSEESGLKNNNITALQFDGKHRVVAGTTNGINIIENDKIYSINSPLSPTTAYVRNLNKAENNKFYIAGPFGLLGNKVFTEEFEGIEYKFFAGTEILPIENNKILIGGWGNYISEAEINSSNEIISEKNYNLFDTVYQNIRVEKIFRDLSGNIWVGTTNGLVKFDSSYKRTVYKGSSILKGDITSIHQDKKNNLWITSENGIAFLSNGEWENIPEINGTYFDNSYDINFDYLNRAWLGTSHGLFLIDNIYGNEPVIIRKYSEHTGFPSNEINAVCIDEKTNTLWAGTSSGIVKLDITVLEDLNPSTSFLYIFSIETKDSVYYSVNPLSDKLILQYNNNNLIIHLSSLNYTNPSGITYRYKFDNEKEWNTTGSNEIHFASLSPGNYSLNISSGVDYEMWSPPVVLNFRIKIPFWRSIYFYVFIGLLFIGLVYAANRYRVNQILARQGRENFILHQINSLKHQALSAMLNPHFIFNCMNTAQSILNTEKDKRIINDFLVTFSKIIRLNLDMAESAFVPLKDEIHRLEMYLKLEKFRFKDRLKYNIIIDSQINIEDTKIPNMILQPFVENSLWHGILPKETGGEISISLKWVYEEIEYIETPMIKIDITDDGVGIENASAEIKEGHISKGIRLIKERLELNEDDIIGYEFIKIKNRIDGIQGTNVEITLSPGNFRTKESIP